MWWDFKVRQLETSQNRAKISIRLFRETWKQTNNITNNLKSSVPSVQPSLPPSLSSLPCIAFFLVFRLLTTSGCIAFPLKACFNKNWIIRTSDAVCLLHGWPTENTPLEPGCKTTWVTSFIIILICPCVYASSTCVGNIRILFGNDRQS